MPPSTQKERGCVTFNVVCTIMIPDDLIYLRSVDEWRDYLNHKYQVDPETVNSFESVAERIAEMWTTELSEFEDVGIFLGIETRKT